MTKRQKELLIGTVLGDCYLQKTGNKNARIRFEHSLSQKDYLVWKVSNLQRFFQGDLEILTRFNTKFGKSYDYVRWQSYASPEIGKIRRLFYDESGRKIIPQDIGKHLTSFLTLAVWFMDDGYFYQRDKIAYIYLPAYSQSEFDLLALTLQKNFGQNPS